MPSTVTWLRPSGRRPVVAGAPVDVERHAEVGGDLLPWPRAAASSRAASVTSRPRTSRRRSTICSMSMHLDAELREGVEHQRGHAGPVLAGQRDQQGPRLLVGRRPARHEVNGPARVSPSGPEQAPTSARRAARSRSPRAARRCVHLVRRHGAAVVGTGQLDDVEAEHGAFDGLDPAGVVPGREGQSAVACAGSSAGRGSRAATRRRRGRPAGGSPRPASCAARSRSRARRPTAPGRRPVRRQTTVRASVDSGTSPTAADDDRLAGLEGGGLNAAGRPGPTGSPGSRQRERDRPGRAAAAGAARRSVQAIARQRPRSGAQAGDTSAAAPAIADDERGGVGPARRPAAQRVQPAWPARTACSQAARATRAQPGTRGHPRRAG